MNPSDIPRMVVRTTVNGRAHEVRVAPWETLADLLRDQLGLMGTKVACEQQVCGACTVLLDDQPVSACTVLAVEADGLTLRTIEGLAGRDGTLHPLQRAFLELGAYQCGFCTPGFIMTSLALLEEQPRPNEHTIREYLSGNICRCTGYKPIVAAVQRAAAEMLESEEHA